MPPIPEGDTLRGMLARMVRDVNAAKGIDLSTYADHHVLDMEQYNLFPNITVLVFADMLSVVRARPGTHVEEAYMDVFAFTRVQTPDDRTPRTKPFDVRAPARRRAAVRPRAQPGRRQLRAHAARAAPARVHAPHGVAHRGVPRREPAPHPRGVPRDRPRGWLNLGLGGLTVDDLLVREEIGDVVKDLARGTDRLDRELMASCYHPDGTDDHNVFRGTGTEFAQWVVDTLPHFQATMHFIGPPRIRNDGDVAKVDTYCVAHHVSKPDADGMQTDMVLGLRYVDRFERRAGPRRPLAHRGPGVRLRLVVHRRVRSRARIRVRGGLDARRPRHDRHHVFGLRRSREETNHGHDRISDGPDGAPEALHLGAADLPFVEIGDGNKLKVIHVDEKEGLWIVENIFQAGYAVQKHRHTGPVWGYTTSGAWKYAEYDYVNRAGSFLYEPAGSIHTLTCIEDDTQVWFHMYGVNLNLAADGSIESVADGAGALAAYYALCEAQGFDRPNVIVA